MVQTGAIWQCLICKEWARTRAKLETKRCKGAVARKWWCKAASSILEKVEDPTIQASKQHRRMYSGEVVWCSVCGCYGEHKARGLTEICDGKFEGIWKGGGRVAQLKSLKANVHPRTGKPIPPAVPESQWLTGVRTAVVPSSACQVLQSVPVTLCRASAAILDRLRLKRRAGQEAADAQKGPCRQPSPKRRRITGKSTPLIVGGLVTEPRLIRPETDRSEAGESAGTPLPDARVVSP